MRLQTAHVGLLRLKEGDDYVEMELPKEGLVMVPLPKVLYDTTRRSCSRLREVVVTAREKENRWALSLCLPQIRTFVSIGRLKSTALFGSRDDLGKCHLLEFLHRSHKF